MVDIHCHILPNVDDGSKSWDISLDMCRMALQDGITHIVATPHANDEYIYDRARHEDSLNKLREEMGAAMKFSLGCDFHFSFENIQDALKTPQKYSISGTNYMLVEFSNFAIHPAMGDALLKMIALGITPIITHPERNLIMQRSPDYVIKFAERGCVVQITANSLTGRWGDTAKKVAKWLLDHDAIHVVASDAHDLSDRPPVLSPARDAIARSHGHDVATALVESNPGAIVGGKLLPYFPQPVPA